MSAATASCRDVQSSEIGQSAPRHPVAPTPIVHTVSTQPEFLVWYRTGHATIIVADKAADTEASTAMVENTVTAPALEPDERLEQAAKPALKLDITLQCDEADASVAMIDEG